MLTIVLISFLRLPTSKILSLVIGVSRGRMAFGRGPKAWSIASSCPNCPMDSIARCSSSCFWPGVSLLSYPRHSDCNFVLASLRDNAVLILGAP